MVVYARGSVERCSISKLAKYGNFLECASKEVQNIAVTRDGVIVVLKNCRVENEKMVEELF